MAASNDLDIFLIVAVNDFQYGAMENKGLIIFHSSLWYWRMPILRRSWRFPRVEAVVRARNISITGSGNRVDCRTVPACPAQGRLYRCCAIRSFSADNEKLGNRHRNEGVTFLRANTVLPKMRPHGPQRSVRTPLSRFPTSYNPQPFTRRAAEVGAQCCTAPGGKGFRRVPTWYFDRHDGRR